MNQPISFTTVSSAKSLRTSFYRTGDRTIIRVGNVREVYRSGYRAVDIFAPDQICDSSLSRNVSFRLNLFDVERGKIWSGTDSFGLNPLVTRPPFTRWTTKSLNRANGERTRVHQTAPIRRSVSSISEREQRRLWINVSLFSSPMIYKLSFA